MTDPNVNDDTGLPQDDDPTMDEPGWAVNPDGTVDVAGLRVPGPLAVQVVAAMRSQYPALTAGLSDVRAVRAVLKYWVTATMQSYAAQQVNNAANLAIAQVQDKARQDAAAAAAKAAAAAEAITEAPATPEPTP